MCFGNDNNNTYNDLSNKVNKIYEIIDIFQKSFRNPFRLSFNNSSKFIDIKEYSMKEMIRKPESIMNHNFLI